MQLLDVVVDTYARGYHKRRETVEGNADVPRFLFMTSGHLGDALTLSYLFPLIQRAHPTCVIDVVAGDWCDPILANNPYIRRLIHLNHANTNRRSISRFAKWRDHIHTTKAAIELLKEESYTASIDVRFSDSPMHFLLPSIKVQKAVGFGSRGFGGLLDEEFFLPDGEFHHLDVMLAMLRSIGVHAGLSDIEPYFNFPKAARLTVRQKLPFLDGRPLLVLFPESGEISRFLPHSFWQQLVGKLLDETDFLLVGCGQLPQTAQLMDQLADDYPDRRDRLHKAVNSLSLSEVAALSELATIAFTLESLPAHLCSIFCPTVSFFKNGTGLQFFPLANYPDLVFHNHQFSRDLTIDRPGFTSVYVDQFNEDVSNQALQWLQMTVAKKA
ncbi:glycosyltransferase family 9 protein [Spirosoma radiotolerans]|uniref:glycosyltransferase family 9 protein n=1 Tax=Spirosoma radiotolerans TaxID=1379870 RepID=UPI001D123373|nr:lipopolysaccharide heptosyltransferase family protein [Spirosoma radiotolerans]